jgi:hypothetical protein
MRDRVKNKALMELGLGFYNSNLVLIKVKITIMATIHNRKMSLLRLTNWQRVELEMALKDPKAELMD